MKSICVGLLTALAPLSAAAQSAPSAQYATDTLAYASSGWVAPGQTVTISNIVTSNISWTTLSSINVRLLNISNGNQIAVQSAAAQASSTNVYPVSQTFTIPAGTPAGRYRATVELVGNTSGGTTSILWADQRAVCFNVVSSQSSLYTVGIRGCSELPNTYMSVQGSQIVDTTNTPVRISAIGWYGLEGGPGSAPVGLSDTGYKNLMNSAKEAGFNTIRIAYSDAGLGTRPNPNVPYPINTTYNPDLLDTSVAQPPNAASYTFLPVLNLSNLSQPSILQRIVAYAGQIGLKIIFDQHQSEGNSSGNTPNGLWFDLDTVASANGASPSPSAPELGMNSDCYGFSNGVAPADGTITYTHFKNNWVTVATTFANNPTVIGFELHNEPSGLPYTYWPRNCDPIRLNWGVTNNAYDYKYMAQDVGNAIGTANPGALVIMEGDGENMNPATPITPSVGMNPNVPGLAGDLTAVGGWGWNTSTAAPNPVVLNVPHKMVYSIHHYPWEITGAKPVGTGYGPTIQNDWNGSWGYLVSQNIAPVVITEMGAFIEAKDYRGLGGGVTSPDALAFMATIVPYLNGQIGPVNATPYDNSIAGPVTGNGNRQAVGYDWWALGAEYENLCCGPQGIEIWAGDVSTALLNNQPDPKGLSNFIPEQLAYTDQMQFRGEKIITPANGLEATPSNTVIAVGGTIADTNGNIWAISDGKVVVNGTADTTTANVTELAYVNGTIWHRNSAGNWWSKTTPSGTWSPGNGTAVSPLQATPVNYLGLNANDPVIDAAGNFWSLGSGMVLVNGVRDTTTANVLAVASKSNLVYQLNNSGQWYSKSSPSTGWAASASPLTASANSSLTLEGGASIVDGSGNFWAIVNGTVLVNGTADTTTANVVELAYVGGSIWQMNNSGLWWSKTSPSASWVIAGNGGKTRPGIFASASKAVTSFGAFALTDGSNVDWSISGDARVMNNGLVDQMTGNVVKLTVYGGKIWQQNAAGSWYYKASITDIWHSSMASPY